MIRVKICGVRDLRDAHAATDAGADALGFNFVPTSPRFIQPDACAKIVRTLPPFVARVGVFANMPRERILEIVREVGLTAIQLHGDELAGDCTGFGLPVIKAIQIVDARSLEQLAVYAGVSAILLDGKSPGGGQPFDWDLARGITVAPVILAGGLHAGNVAEAIGMVRPYAVDVASGVESEPGRKDPEKLRAFMAAVRGAEGRA